MSFRRDGVDDDAWGGYGDGRRYHDGSSRYARLRAGNGGMQTSSQNLRVRLVDIIKGTMYAFARRRCR